MSNVFETRICSRDLMQGSARAPIHHIGALDLSYVGVDFDTIYQCREHVRLYIYD